MSLACLLWTHPPLSATRSLAPADKATLYDDEDSLLFSPVKPVGVRAHFCLMTW